MKKKKFLHYWSIVLVLAFVALMVVLVASSTSVQALDGDQASVIQATPPAPTVIVPTVVLPTAVVPTVVIPNTGGDTVIIDLFSNWVLWAVLGVLVIVLLIALAARPGGPDIHHHHDL